MGAPWWIVAVGAVAGLGLIVDCRFDESGIPGGTFPQFDGCFEGGTVEEIVLNLDNHSRVLLDGRLVFRREGQEQTMALAGEVESDTLAVLTGTQAGDGSTPEVIVLALPGDRLSVQVQARPPSGPLSRCP